MPTRLIDYLKARGITMLCTSLMDSEEDGQVAQEISSPKDTWIRRRMNENRSERNRSVSVVKSRGMAYSNRSESSDQNQCAKITDLYLGQIGRH